MSGPSDATVSPTDAERIRALWMEAAVPVRRRQTADQFPAFGLNFRIDVLKAVHASWQAAQLSAKVVAFAHAPFHLASAVGIGASAVSAAKTIIAALVEEMRPIDYVTYVLLARTPDGVPSGVLERQVTEFLATPESIDIAWHLGMGEELVTQAKEVAAEPDWLEGVLGSLEGREMVERRGEKVTAITRNYAIGWDLE